MCTSDLVNPNDSITQRFTNTAKGTPSASRKNKIYQHLKIIFFNFVQCETFTFTLKLLLGTLPLQEDLGIIQTKILKLYQL